MLHLSSTGTALCDGISRRRFLSVGSLVSCGLTLPKLLSANESKPTKASTSTFGRAKRCLMIYMWGGPSHIDTLDMKPHAPLEYRGEFAPIASNVPGLFVCEHMPHMARQMDKLAIVRSVTHTDNNHSTSAHWMLTGKQHSLSAENFNAAGSDFPHIGSVLTKLTPAREMPTFVALPEVIATTAGAVTPGQGGGILGKQYDPFRINDHPDDPDFEVRDLTLPTGVSLSRLDSRRELLSQFDQLRADMHRSIGRSELDAMRQQAFDIVLSPKVYNAFHLNAEANEVRDRYGRHTFGQSLLMARRLLEAGTKLVTVYWHRDEPGVDTTWDTHGDNFKQLKNRLIPQVDQPLSVMLDDLKQRGLLDDTLIVWNSEFGRTPKINKRAGRDHWGRCNTLWFAGAGIAGGRVHGETDRIASVPIDQAVSPADISATIYHLLGLHAHTEIHDSLERPHFISDGEVIHPILSST